MDKKNLTGQIHNAMYQSIKKCGYATTVDVLIDIGVISKKDYENWRYGKIDYLEKVCSVNLHVLSNIMKEMRSYAVKNNLKSSWTCYHQWGKQKEHRLRFSKSNNEDIERNYATHFVDVKITQELREQKKLSDDEIK